MRDRAALCTELTAFAETFMARSAWRTYFGEAGRREAVKEEAVLAMEDVGASLSAGAGIGAETGTGRGHGEGQG